MLDGAGEEAAGAAGRVEDRLAELGVDHVDHELGDGARRVELAGVAGALQVLEDLLVDVAEEVAVVGAVEVDLVDLVDHLPDAGCRSSCSCRHPRTPTRTTRPRPLVPAFSVQLLEGREQLVVDEVEQLVAGDAFGVGGPVAPAQLLRDRRLVVVVEQFQLLLPGRRRSSGRTSRPAARCAGRRRRRRRPCA